jgi:Fic family protein
MTYILQIHQDPTFELNAQFIKGLHFMMMGHDLANLPGQWRQGAVHVVSEPSGETVHTSPDAELIAGLMNELIAEIYARDGAADIIRAAFIHLNLSMIHPFKDGNGRMARALQTLILAREGILSPAFCSIEEWLGRNTSEYYKVLAEVGQGSWNPTNDSAPWVRFCLRAHYQQAATLIKRNQEIGRLWGEVEKIITAYALHDRMEIALMDAAFGLQVRNQRYRQENDISDVMASRDLRKLCELNLLVPVGEKRGRYYTAAAPLKKLREETRDTRRAGDPYELIGQESAPEIPGLQ